MQELEAIRHVAIFEVLERLQDFGRGEPEFGSKPGARLPSPRAAGCQLDAHADDRSDVQLLAVADDRFELRELLDDRDDLLADLPRQHGHLDEFVVLEAVADDRSILGFRERQHGQQLRLGAGFQPEMERLAEIEDLLDDLPLLIHLDRIDAAILSLVFILANGRLEGVLDLADAMAEDIREPQQDRQLNAALLELIDQLFQVDRLARDLVGMNRDVPGSIDTEIAFPPVTNAISFDRILNLPRIGKSVFNTFRHSRNLPSRVADDQSALFTLDRLSISIDR